MTEGQWALGDTDDSPSPLLSSVSESPERSPRAIHVFIIPGELP